MTRAPSPGARRGMSGMGGIRRMAREAASGGVLVAATTAMLLLQVLIVAYAQAAMAVSETRPPLVICTPRGIVALDTAHPLEDLAADCCSPVCQAACASTAALPPNDAALCLKTTVSGEFRRLLPDTRAPPRFTGASRQARGPPLSA